MSLIKAGQISLKTIPALTPKRRGKGFMDSKTIEAYNNHVNHFQALYGLSQGRDDVLRNAVEYIFTVKDKGSKSSAAQAKQAMKEFIQTNFPEIDRARLVAVFEKIEIKNEQRNQTGKALTQKEVETMIDNQKTRQKLFTRFLFNTGFRVSEMLDLKLKNCEHTGNTVSVKVSGKFDKTVISEIPVSLFESVKKEFNSKEFLFQNNKSKSGKFSRQYIYRIMRESEKFIHRKITPHILRHSIATALINAGESIHAVKEFLNHSDVTTTARFYLHDTVKPKTKKAVWI